MATTTTGTISTSISWRQVDRTEGQAITISDVGEVSLTTNLANGSRNWTA